MGFTTEGRLLRTIEYVFMTNKEAFTCDPNHQERRQKRGKGFPMQDTAGVLRYRLSIINVLTQTQIALRRHNFLSIKPR